MTSIIYKRLPGTDSIWKFLFVHVSLQFTKKNHLQSLLQLLNHYLVIIMVAIAFCLLAWYKRWLNISGAVAACILAIIILFSGGWVLAVPMVFFFITSSLFSKLPSRALLVEIKNKKPRDYVQVACNGGVAGLVCILYLLTKNPVLILLYFISISISICDTWSSETGNYFKGNVFDVISFERIEKGLSGGISFKGSFAGFVGSLLVGLLYFFLYEKDFIIVIIITIAGFAGMLTDSIMGSLLQAKYMDEEHHVSEWKMPGNSTLYTGYPWISNDLVNLFSNAIITCISFGIMVMFD